MTATATGLTARACRVRARRAAVGAAVRAAVEAADCRHSAPGCSRPRACSACVSARRSIRTSAATSTPRSPRLAAGPRAQPPGADARRDRLLEDIPTKAGFDRDEYPAAVGRGRANGEQRGLVRGINPIGWMADVAYVLQREPLARLVAGREAAALLRRHALPLRVRLALRGVAASARGWGLRQATGTPREGRRARVIISVFACSPRMTTQL